MYWLTGVRSRQRRSWASSYDVSKAMNSSSVPARATIPRSATRSSWVLRMVRGDSGTGAWSSQTRSHCTSDAAGQVGQQPDRVVVGHELHVAVALLPRGDGVAVDGVHVDVDREEVVAALGARLQRDVQEVLPVQALALEPALHVGEGEHDGVDLAHLDPVPQVWQGQVAVVGGHGSPRRSISPAGRAGARPCRRSALPWSGGPGRAAPPARHAPARRAGVSEWLMLVSSTGIALSISWRLAWTEVTDSTTRGDPDSDAIVRWNRESACRCRARLVAPDDRPVGRLQGGPGPVVEAVSTRPCAAAPGSTIRRKLRASSQSVRCAGRGAVRGPGRRTLGLHGDDRAAATAASGLDESGRAQRGHRLPQGGPRDLEPLGELALRRQGAAERVHPEPDRGGQLLDAGLEGVMTADRAHDDLGERQWFGGHAGQSGRRRFQLSMVWVQTEYPAWPLDDAIATGLASGQPVPFLKGCTDARIA